MQKWELVDWVLGRLCVRYLGRWELGCPESVCLAWDFRVKGFEVWVGLLCQAMGSGEEQPQTWLEKGFLGWDLRVWGMMATLAR